MELASFVDAQPSRQPDAENSRPLCCSAFRSRSSCVRAAAAANSVTAVGIEVAAVVVQDRAEVHRADPVGAAGLPVRLSPVAGRSRAPACREQRQHRRPTPAASADDQGVLRSDAATKRIDDASSASTSNSDRQVALPAVRRRGSSRPNRSRRPGCRAGRCGRRRRSPRPSGGSTGHELRQADRTGERAAVDGRVALLLARQQQELDRTRCG